VTGFTGTLRWISIYENRFNAPSSFTADLEKKNFTEGFYLYKIASVMEVNSHLTKNYIRITLCAVKLTASQLTNTNNDFVYSIFKLNYVNRKYGQYDPQIFGLLFLVWQTVTNLDYWKCYNWNFEVIKIAANFVFISMFNNYLQIIN